ncbi:Uncharacterized protein TCM_009022 [Theobroma cacao]|uniref:Uncharacterized protein n=1 Tax=Theobroma cacao TaxID=3641 RepID=A0A061E4P3_THECC|nr:Uncharacterized protein TCM_009022 [Theobroma cacao]
MREVKSDLSFASLMNLVEDVVGVNSLIYEIELHALISILGELLHLIIKDEEDVALILLEQRNVPIVYVTIKECHTNVMPHEEAIQYVETKHVRSVDVEDDQCDYPTYNNPIVSDNGICLPKILPNESYQERGNARANGVALRPKDIIGEMRVQRGLECLCGKAWQAKEYVERFKGVLFVTVCKDANECIYPVAFGISHVEDEDSWMQSFSNLSHAIEQMIQ